MRSVPGSAQQMVSPRIINSRRRPVDPFATVQNDRAYRVIVFAREKTLRGGRPWRRTHPSTAEHLVCEHRRSKQCSWRTGRYADDPSVFANFRHPYLQCRATGRCDLASRRSRRTWSLRRRSRGSRRPPCVVILRDRRSLRSADGIFSPYGTRAAGSDRIFRSRSHSRSAVIRRAARRVRPATSRASPAIRAADCSSQMQGRPQPGHATVRDRAGQHAGHRALTHRMENADTDAGTLHEESRLFGRCSAREQRGVSSSLDIASLSSTSAGVKRTLHSNRLRRFRPGSVIRASRLSVSSYWLSSRLTAQGVLRHLASTRESMSPRFAAVRAWHG